MGESGEKPTRAVEDYVKAIYLLAEREAAVTTTALASHLQVTPSSVSAMLARLRAMVLISHRPYAEVSLTEPGLRACDAGDPPPPGHRAVPGHVPGLRLGGGGRRGGGARACRHGPAGRADGGEAGDPRVDPHGDPIPSPDGRIDSRPSCLLSTLEPGSTGTLVRVWNGDPDVLRYLDSCGVELGNRIEVLGREPFGGSMVVRVGEPKEGRVHGFGYGLAEVLSIELD
jgi:DtxR family Mn-dependent transcriptional regulator